MPPSGKGSCSYSSEVILCNIHCRQLCSVYVLLELQSLGFSLKKQNHGRTAQKQIVLREWFWKAVLSEMICSKCTKIVFRDVSKTHLDYVEWLLQKIDQ